MSRTTTTMWHDTMRLEQNNHDMTRSRQEARAYKVHPLFLIFYFILPPSRLSLATRHTTTIAIQCHHHQPSCCWNNPLNTKNMPAWACSSCLTCFQPHEHLGMFYVFGAFPTLDRLIVSSFPLHHLPFPTPPSFPTPPISYLSSPPLSSPLFPFLLFSSPPLPSSLLSSISLFSLSYLLLSSPSLPPLYFYSPSLLLPFLPSLFSPLFSLCC